MAKLVYREADQLKEFEITHTQTTIGRSSRNALKVKDPLCSKMHCIIEKLPDGYRILDLKSTNGTFVNGQKIQHDCALKDGDKIKIGTTELVFLAPELVPSAEEPLPTQKADVVKLLPPKEEEAPRKKLVSTGFLEEAKLRKQEAMVRAKEQMAIRYAIIGGGGLLAIIVLFLIIGSLTPPEQTPPSEPQKKTKKISRKTQKTPVLQPLKIKLQGKEMYRELKEEFEDIKQEMEVKPIVEFIEKCEEFKHKYPASTKMLERVLLWKEKAEQRKIELLKEFIFDLERRVDEALEIHQFAWAIQEVNVPPEYKTVLTRPTLENLKLKITTQANTYFNEQIQEVERLRRQKQYQKALDILFDLDTKLGEGMIKEFKSRHEHIQKLKKLIEEEKGADTRGGN